MHPATRSTIDGLGDTVSALTTVTFDPNDPDSKDYTRQEFKKETDVNYILDRFGVVQFTRTPFFGYQERWHEYRTVYSDVTGIMRSSYTGTLDAWHLAQRFTSPPTLSGAFIRDEPPMDRVLAAGTAAIDQQYIADIMIRRTATRPMPTFGTPALLGRF